MKYEDYNDVEDKTSLFGFRRKRRIICKVMLNGNKVLASRKVKLGVKDFQWRKKIFNIDYNAVIEDDRNRLVYFVDVNDSIGALYLTKRHATSPLNDSGNLRELIKRKTINAIWGIDSIPMILLIIMGIIMMVLVLAVFYVYQDNIVTHAKLDQYLKPPPVLVVPEGSIQQ